MNNTTHTAIATVEKKGEPLTIEELIEAQRVLRAVRYRIRHSYGGRVETDVYFNQAYKSLDEAGAFLLALEDETPATETE